MSIFDKFLESSALTFQIANKFSSKASINPKKTVLFEGELAVKAKDYPAAVKFFKLVDRKLICSSSRGSPPLFFYDLMMFLKIEYDKSKTWFSLEKLNQRHEFMSSDKNVLLGFIKVLKLYCISNDFLNNYKIMETLGKGHFSHVYKVKHLESGNLLAAKHMKLQALKDEYKAYIFREVSILKSIPKNAHIIKLYEIYEQQHEIILVFEYMSEGDLYKKIKGDSLTEYQICMYFCQILKGLVFLHSNGVVHRDIKPDNILLTKNKAGEAVIKIADFSLAEYFHENRLNTVCGTPGYMAPEMFCEEEYDEKVDVFSLGVILFMMFTKSTPFHGKTSKEVMEKNKAGEIKFKKKDWSEISHSGKKLVTALVSKYPGQRLSLQNIFLHKWVRKYYFESMQASKTANLEIRSSHKEDEYKCEMELHRSQSEILISENEYHVPTEKEKTTEAASCQTKYVFSPPKNKFINNSDFLPSKISVSTNEQYSSNKCATTEFHHSPLRVTGQFNENMNLNSVNSLFLCSRSSFTSDFNNIKSKSSISEELFGKYSLSRKDVIEINNGPSGLGSSTTGAGGFGIFTTNPEKSFKNEFTLFNRVTNIFTEPIKEITMEENTNKTNKTNKTTVTMEFEESPIHGLMAGLRAETKPKKPSKEF